MRATPGLPCLPTHSSRTCRTVIMAWAWAWGMAWARKTWPGLAWLVALTLARFIHAHPKGKVGWAALAGMTRTVGQSDSAS